MMNTASDDRIRDKDISIITMANEKINQQFNAGRGMWPLIAQQFEQTAASDKELGERIGQILVSCQAD
jgi:hypothetical protein